MKLHNHNSKTICYLEMGVISDQMLDMLAKLNKEDLNPKKLGRYKVLDHYTCL